LPNKGLTRTALTQFAGLESMMTEIDILKAQIVRQDVRQPWGFQLQGGADVEQPLSINRVRYIYRIKLIYLFIFLELSHIAP